ncbi:hypothetical protein VPH35_021255 [Triticum aestivum]|uniref:uncharacterized protein n=1 Tax=Triticum aestivum TaxID=4565 RepID=UPI0001BA814C|nr:uncharacterized protein LOC123185399 [Triticum aestivum]
MLSHEQNQLHLSLPNYRAGRRRLDLPLPAISGDTADTHRIPSTPSTISPHLFDPPPPKSSPPSNPSAACLGSGGFATARGGNDIYLPMPSTSAATRTRRATTAVGRERLHWRSFGNMPLSVFDSFIYCYHSR